MLQLQQWVANAVGQTSCKRGYEYFRDGRVELDTCSSHQGRNVNETAEVIRGHISGSDLTPYSAWASISEDAMTDAHCSCPVGQQGKCKHVAALLFAAKAGPEHAGAKTHIATSPAATNAGSPAGASRQLWHGPFSSEKPTQAASVGGFRAQISPKKSVWGTNLLSSPPSASAPFAVAPGFSLRDHSALATRQFTEFPSASQPTSPFKAKQEPRSSLYPTYSQPSSHGAMSSSPAHVVTPHLSQPESMELGETSTAQDTSVFTSTTTAPSLDTSIMLQEELHSSRLYASNLDRQCDLLRDQVHMLQAQLTRQNAEIVSLRHQLDAQTHALAQVSQHKTSPPSTSPQQRPRPVIAQTAQSMDVAPVEPSEPAPEPEELRDSIETSSDEGVVNSKKRSRTYEAEDKPGLVKRLSFETTSAPATSPPAASAAAPQAPVEEAQGTMDTSVDESDALIAALDQFESRREQTKKAVVGAVTLPLSRNATPASSQTPFPVARALSFEKMTQGSANLTQQHQATPPNSPSPSQGSASEETLHASSKPTSPISHSIAIITQQQEADSLLT